MGGGGGGAQKGALSEIPPPGVNPRREACMTKMQPSTEITANTEAKTSKVTYTRRRASRQQRP